MIYPKTRTLKTSILYAKDDATAKRASSGNWRNRFLKAHRDPKKRNLKADDFIPECYNYAWGYF